MGHSVPSQKLGLSRGHRDPQRSIRPSPNEVAIPANGPLHFQSTLPTDSLFWERTPCDLVEEPLVGRNPREYWFGKGSGALLTAEWNVTKEAAKDDREPLGARIRRLRQDLGFTQDRLALRANVDQSGLSKLERGRSRSMGRENLSRIAAVLGLTLEQLTDGTDH